MTTWVWAVGPGASAATPGPVRELTTAFGRVGTWRTGGHGFAQFSIDGRHDEAAAIVERESDIWAYRDGTLMFRGRVLPGNEDIGERHNCQFTVIDYRGMLTEAAQIESPVPTFTNVDQAVIAWELVEHAQTQTGGDWGITEGLGPTSGVLRDETDLRVAQPVGEAIDRLAERDNGFEWEISPTLELNRWYPTRGSNNGVILDYGGNIVSVSVTPGEFANAVTVTGDNTTTPVTAEHSSLITDQRGRWTASQAYSSVSLQTTLDDKAVWAVNRSVTIEDQLAVRFAPGRWEGPAHVWIGDTVKVHVNSGRRQINGDHRVLELRVVCGDNGTETVTASVVAVDPGAPAGKAPIDQTAALAQYFNSIASRVAELERSN